MGNIDGCLHPYWGPGEFRASNTYIERDTELFVGCIDGADCGTFETTYVFTAKYEDDQCNGQKFGRCQHPVITGSGTGDFTGTTGRLDFKDDLVAGNFPPRRARLGAAEAATRSRAPISIGACASRMPHVSQNAVAGRLQARFIQEVPGSAPEKTASPSRVATA